MSDIVPPCDCAEQVDGKWTSRCYCSNRDDGESTAMWCVEANNADTITTLRAEVERLRAALETIAECSTDDTAIICARAALEGAPLFSPAALAQEKPND